MAGNLLRMAAIGMAMAGFFQPTVAAAQPNEPPVPSGLACDDTLKAKFRPDAQTSVVLVRLFRTGDVVALAKDNPARAPRATNDVCLVKLNIGPGQTGPAGAPSTSQGIGVEVWLPSAANWNNRIHAIGGGGWQGGQHGSPDAIGASYAFAVADIEGAVSSTTDTGHANDVVLGTGNPRGDFAMNPDGSISAILMRDFATRAIHEQAVKTKALTAAFYGRPAKFSYWEGGSTGGRQGHKLAQAHPDDFDGIIANYPALHWSRLTTSMLYPQVVIQRDLAGQPLSEAQLDLVSNAAIAACDVVAGQHLGYVLDPSRCRYDPTKDAEVLCAADGGRKGSPNCVSKLQARAINKMWYGPTRDGSVPDPAVDNGWNIPTSGKHLWYGPSRGTSLWGAYFTRLFRFPAGVANPGAANTLATDMVALALGDGKLSEPGFKNAKGDGQGSWKSLSYTQYASALDRARALDRSTLANIDTVNPDLSAFEKSGGKMLFWHGGDDEIIPAQGSIQYYDSVLKRMGGSKRVHSFYRLYLVPGNGHMSPNGTSNPSANPPVFGPGQLYGSLVDWLEKGIAPGRVEIESPSETGARLSQPACPYPSKVTYVSGDPRIAASYVCSG